MTLEKDTDLFYQFDKTYELESTCSDIRRIDMKPFPDASTLAQFSNEVYTIPEDFKESYESYTNRLKLPQDWVLLATAENSQKTNGYFGAAYYNASQMQVVVAHRGTVSWYVGFFTDVLGVGLGWVVPQIKSAVTFTSYITSRISEAESPKRRFQISFTGHSLGGWLAQITTFTTKYLRPEENIYKKKSIGKSIDHSHTVTFESPGCLGMLEKLADSYDFRYKPFMDLSRLDIVVYLNAPNLINSFSTHVGDVYRIINKTKDTQKMTMKDYLNFTHNMSNTLEAISKLKEPNEYELQKVSDWICIKKWPPLTEYVQYQKMANSSLISQGRNQLTENHRVSSESYNNTECSRRVFTAAEILFLECWAECKKNVQMNKISNFLQENNLGGFEMFLPEFKLENDQPIKCLDLDKLIRHTKQLVRWYSKENIEKLIKDQQNDFKTGPKMFFLMISNIYMNSLMRMNIQPVDEFGLSQFLSADDQRLLYIETEHEQFDAARININLKVARGDISLVKYTSEDAIMFVSWAEIITVKNCTDITKIFESGINTLVLTGLFLDEENASLQKIFESLNDTKKMIVISKKKYTEYKRMWNLHDSQVTHVAIKNQRCLKDITEKPIKDFMKIELFEGKFKTLQDAFGIDESKLKSNPWVEQMILEQNILELLLKETSQRIVIEKNPSEIETFDVKCCIISRELSTDKFASFILKLIDGQREGKSEILVIDTNRSDMNSERLCGRLNITDEDTKIKIDETLHDQTKIKLCLNMNKRQFQEICKENFNVRVIWVKMNRSMIICDKIYDSDFCMKREFLTEVFIQNEIRNIIDKINDIFIFENVLDRDKLARILQDANYQRNNKKYYNPAKIIFIKPHQSVENEYERICKEKNDSVSVHWIKYEESNTRFIWQRSKGSLNSIREYVSRDYNLRTTEEHLVSKDMWSQRRVTIITAQPGTGKSTALATLSEKISSPWVLQVDLRDNDFFGTDTSDDCYRHYQKFFDVILQDETEVIKLFYKYNLIYGTDCPVHLLFDGYDEMQNKNMFVTLVKSLVKKTCAKIWITSRAHCSELLENELATFPVEFYYVSREDVQNYWQKYWSSQLTLDNDEADIRNKVTVYVTKLYKEVETILGKDIVEFLAIPLHMRMIADVAVPQGDDFSLPKGLKNIHDLYKAFINVKYDIYFKNKSDLKPILKQYIENMFEKQHNSLSFEYLFNHIAKKHMNKKRLLKKYKDDKIIELNNVGIVEIHNDKKYKFIHITFAEYFASNLIANQLEKKERNQRYSLVEVHLLQEVFLKERYRKVRTFLRHGSEQYFQKEHNNNWSEVTKLWLNNKHHFLDAQYRTALHNLVAENNTTLVQYIINAMNDNLTPDNFVDFISARDRNGDTALYIAAKLQMNKEGDLVEKFLNSVQSRPLKVQQKLLWSTLFRMSSDENNAVIQNVIDIINTKPEYQHLKLVCEDIKTSWQWIDPFLEAANMGNIHGLIEILKKKATFVHYLTIATEESGCTALHLAAAKGYSDIVKYLLNQRKDIVNTVDQRGRTALHKAVKYNHLDVIKILHANGGNINVRDINGLNPINIHAIHITIRNGNSINHCVFNTSVVQSSSSHSPIDTVIREDVLSYLVQKGGDYQNQDKNGNTPLHHAVKYDHIDTVRYLLGLTATTDKGKDYVNMVNNVGKTALHKAAEMNFFEIVKLIHSSGGDVNIKTFKGLNAINVSAKNNAVELIKFLVQNGGDYKNRCRKGNTALHDAAKCGHTETVKYLVQQGCLINDKNNRGFTPASITAHFGRLDTIKYLISQEANMNSIDNHGHSVLLTAIISEKLEIVKELLKVSNIYIYPEENWEKSLKKLTKQKKINMNILHCLLDYTIEYQNPLTHESMEMCADFKMWDLVVKMVNITNYTKYLSENQMTSLKRYCIRNGLIINQLNILGQIIYTLHYKSYPLMYHLV